MLEWGPQPTFAHQGSRETSVLLYIIRHGQSYNTHPRPSEPDPVNPPLTPIGREQSFRLARRFVPLGLTRLVSSPMLRTVETARVIACEVGLPVEVRPGWQEFREAPGYPCWGGRELAARYSDLVIAPEMDPEDWEYGGESRDLGVARAQSLLGWLAAEASARPDGKVAVISHGAITQIVLGQVLRAGFAQMERVVIDNTAVSTLSFSAVGVDVLGINDTAHLAGWTHLDPLAGVSR